MKKHTAAAALLLASVSCLAGCSWSQPSYQDVRREAMTALDEVAAVVPDPKEVTAQPESEPYSCSDPLLLFKRDGAFYTGQWAVYVPADFDFDAFVPRLPSLLGSEWQEQSLGVESSSASIYLVNDSLGLSLSVDEAEIGGRPALDLIAISRCGILADGDRTQAPMEPSPFDPLG